MSASKDRTSRTTASKAAAAFAEARRRQRRRNLLVGLAVAAVLAVVVGVGVLVSVLGDDSDDRVESGAAEAGTSEHGLVVGPEDAPHEIVIYEDFLCPICGIVETTAGERLGELAAQGEVRIDYRPMSILQRFGPYSEAAANAFFVVRDEAGPEVAQEFHDLLFAEQPSEAGPFPGDDWLVEKAVQAGAEEDAVRPGIEGAEAAEEVAAATQAGVDAGVSGTPTILLDGKVFDDGRSWEEIATNLVEAVEPD